MEHTHSHTPTRRLTVDLLPFMMLTKVGYQAPLPEEGGSWRGCGGGVWPVSLALPSVGELEAVSGGWCRGCGGGGEALVQVLEEAGPPPLAEWVRGEERVVERLPTGSVQVVAMGSSTPEPPVGTPNPFQFHNHPLRYPSLLHPL